MNARLVFILLISITLSAVSTGIAQEEIKWYTVEEAFEAGKKEQRKFFIDVYTTWCGPWRKMSATTLKHPVIVRVLNKYYYPIKLNAERRDTIVFMDSSFVSSVPANKRGPHDFAKFIVHGPKMVYPSLVFMNERAQWMQVIQSAMTPQSFEPVIKYFAQIKLGQENLTYDDFMKTFVPEVQAPVIGAPPLPNAHAAPK